MTIGAYVGKQTGSEVARRDDSSRHLAASPGKQTLTEGLTPPSAALNGHASSGASSGAGEQAGGSAVPHGWIVQHVVVQQNVTDASSTAVTPGTATYGGLQTAWYPLWEAWQVRGGQVFVGGSTSPHNADTYSQDPVGPNTKGATRVVGLADSGPRSRRRGS